MDLRSGPCVFAASPRGSDEFTGGKAGEVLVVGAPKLGAPRPTKVRLGVGEADGWAPVGAPVRDEVEAAEAALDERAIVAPDGVVW